MKRFYLLNRKIIYHLCRASAYVAATVVALMMLLTVFDIFFRSVFNSPISGTTEITEFMMIVIIFPALAWCALTKRHIRVDLLVSVFPKWLRVVLDIFTLLATLFIFTIIAWQSLLESMYVDTTTAFLNVPHYPFYWVLTIGLILLCLSIVVLIVDNFVKEVKE